MSQRSLLSGIAPADRFATALALNRALFSTYAGITPDPWQKQVLLSNHKRILLNCSRQSGKSTTLATICVHTALYGEQQLVLLLSPTQRQSSEIFKRCLFLYRVLGKPVPPAAETALTLELRNGSRILSLPGGEGGVRGFSKVSVLVIDEASRVDDALYSSVRPMLAVSGGRLLAASTPWGRRGFWYEAWEGTSGEEWQHYEVPATECPRISAEFLEQERRTLGEWYFNQEYGCQFGDPQDSLFRSQDIARMFEEEVAPW